MGRGEGKRYIHIYPHQTMGDSSPDHEAKAWVPESATTLTRLRRIHHQTGKQEPGLQSQPLVRAQMRRGLMKLRHGLGPQLFVTGIKEHKKVNLFLGSSVVFQ